MLFQAWTNYKGDTHTSDSGKIIAIVLWNQVSVNNDKTNWNVSRGVHGIFFSLFCIGSYFCLLKLCAVLTLRLKSYVYNFLFLMLKYLYVFFSWNFFDFHHIQRYDLFLSAIQVCPLSSHSLTHWQHIACYVFWVHIYRIVYILYWIFLCSRRYAVSVLTSSCHLSLFYK